MKQNTLKEPENVGGIYDMKQNAVYFNKGNVIKFRSKRLQTLPNEDMVFNELNRWARFRGHIQDDEVVGSII